MFPVGLALHKKIFEHFDRLACQGQMSGSHDMALCLCCHLIVAAAFSSFPLSTYMYEYMYIYRLLLAPLSEVISIILLNTKCPTSSRTQKQPSFWRLELAGRQHTYNLIIY